MKMDACDRMFSKHRPVPPHLIFKKKKKKGPLGSGETKAFWVVSGLLVGQDGPLSALLFVPTLLKEDHSLSVQS